MCGLAGVAGNGIIGQDVSIFKELLYVSSLRGRDSTGIVTVDTNRPKENYSILKTGDPSPDFIEQFSYKGGPWSYQGQNLMMGHCRWATVGDTSAANAHPFEFSQIIGMHNGTLEDLKYLYSKDKTDSEMMFQDMNARGIKTVLDELKWNSAYAITVYDKKTRRLYMARNKKRTLYVGFNKFAGVMYWASEAHMLHLIAARNNITIETFWLQPDTLYEINVNDIKIGETAPWKTIALQEKFPPPVSNIHMPAKKQKKQRDLNSSTTYDMYNDDIPWSEYIQ